MRPNRLIAAVLCLTVGLPPGAFAQTAAPTASASASAPPSGDALTTPTATIDANVFGLYGGAAARFANRPGEKAGLQASMNALQLPDLGDGSGGALTPQAERRLGERLMRDLRRDPDYLDDWLIRDYLNSVAARLSAAAATQYIGGYLPDFDLFPVRDPQINAFSMPGGFIGVNTGLIATSQTESELASVIGHEMGHVLQRHIARMMGSSERSGYAALAAMLFGVLAGVVAHSGDLGMGIAMGGQAFALDNQLRFSRSAEHEADRVGFQMLSAAGYDPYAMVSFFARLDRTAMGDNGVPPYLRTHPLTGERMADMEDRARRVPYRQPRQEPEYGFVRARARVLQANSTSEYRDVATRLRSEIEDQTALNVAANWYGIALAQTLQRDYDAANASLAEARKVFDAEPAQEDRPASAEQKAPMVAHASNPLPSTSSIDVASPASAALASLNAAKTPATVVNLGTIAAKRPQDRSSPSLDVLAADIARLAGHDNEAIHLADIAQVRWPASHAAIETHLQALLSARRFTEAQALARRETRDDPNQPDWWRYLAQASAGANDAMQQHRAMAEKLALDGAWPSAIRQLQAARDLKNAGFYDLSTISARLRDFETRYKEEREMEKDDS
ncbi:MULTISPECIES: M48 family metalloprotease [Burkholderiaceae]|uniref:Exported zinc metalloprotease YfgC n=1 Tax=Caballeronia sordidicola TaxID=196367 RepID=A0A242MNX2_CABSO|nr:MULTISPECIES: M48 family metalloprotease [Burkholderiaceae]AME23951.1 peptidase M48 [Burkholderia sp. PAMC 26561]OTP73017.1 Exported zinc metalloprotease YfgC precursor [Caballeronia sordidicola]